IEEVSSASRVFSYRMEEVKVPSGVAAPPPHEEARVARYMTHYSDWGHLATISTQQQVIKGLPFGNIFSVSDGPADNTGVKSLYMSCLHLKTKISLTEIIQVYDPEDPRCARLTLTGKMVEVGPEELDFAKEAMFSRHPVMKKWPPGHNWFFMKLVLQQVWLQDWVGGVSVIPLEEYFEATPF
uniref:Cellular repressor of E1A-stimulated genes 2 n=1 Tax=Cyprinus carpio carpio TaxID=630221 RepID=A0A9J8BSC9_CYPCA